MEHTDENELVRTFEEAELLCEEYNFYVKYWFPNKYYSCGISMYSTLDEVKKGLLDRDIDLLGSTFDVFKRGNRWPILEIDICKNIINAKCEQFIGRLESELIKRVFI